MLEQLGLSQQQLMKIEIAGLSLKRDGPGFDEALELAKTTAEENKTVIEAAATFRKRADAWMQLNGKK